MEATPTNWEERFQAGTTGWERRGLNPAFAAWRDAGAFTPCRILVPGAGRSPEPLALAEAGFEVTLVDSAPSAVAAQRTRFEAEGRKAAILEADLLAWEADRPFDAIYEQTCLCALLPPQRAAYVQRLERWLKPGGTLFALFMQTDKEGGPPYDCPVDVMKALFPTSRWEWPQSLPQAVPHSPGLAEQPAILRRK
jgi:methyl halide transferase